MFDFLKLKTDLDSWRAQLEKLRSERERLLREKERLESAPKARADVEEDFSDYINAQAAEYAKRLAQEMRATITKPLREGAFVSQRGVGPMLIAPVRTGGNGQNVASFHDLQIGLCAIFPDQMKAAVTQVLDGTDFKDAGPLRVARVKRLAEIDGLVADLDEHERILIGGLADAGVAL